MIQQALSTTGKGSKKSQQSKGRSISGLTAKLHLAITSDFKIIEGFLTGGNTGYKADNLTSNVSGCYVIEDKGYDSDTHRENLVANNNVSVIPGRRNRREPVVYNKLIYKNVISKCFLVEENRRLAL